MLDTSLIGRELPPKTIAVEEGQLRFFAKTVCPGDPIYRDREAARHAGHSAIPAPPTFLFSLDLLAESGGENILQLMGVELWRVLHGEQRFVYGEPIYAGDVITLTTAVKDIYEKKGGALQFVVAETRAENQSGASVGRMLNTIVVRN